MSSSYWKYKNSKSKQFSTSNTLNIPKEPPKKSIHKWQYGKGLTKDKVKIASWNVNGIRSVYSRRFLQPYLQQNSIDILCVMQTKIDQVAFEKAPINLHGYSGYWNFCKCSSGYSGVAIFSRFLPISMQEDLPQLKHCQQGRIITLQFDKFYIIAVYAPNSGSKLERLPYRANQFDRDFLAHLERLRLKKHVIVAGDFNVVRDEIDIYKSEGKIQMSQQMPACTIQERNNFDKLLKSGYIDTFREAHPEKVQYTWWNMKIDARKRNIGWRIDYILINQEMKDSLIDAAVHDHVMGSDHCPVWVCLDLSKVNFRQQNDESLKNIIIQDLPDQNSDEILLMCEQIIEEKKKNKSEVEDKQHKDQICKNKAEEKKESCESTEKKEQKVETRKSPSKIEEDASKKASIQNRQQDTAKKGRKREPIKFQTLYQMQQLTNKLK